MVASALPSPHRSSQLGLGALTSAPGAPPPPPLHSGPPRRGRAPFSFSNSLAQTGAFFLFAPFAQAFPSAPPQDLQSRPHALQAPLCPSGAASPAGPRLRGRWSLRPRPSTHLPQAVDGAGGACEAAAGGGQADGRGRGGGRVLPGTRRRLAGPRGGGGTAAWGSGPRSAQGFLGRSCSGSGDQDASAATPARAACLRSGTRQTPRRGGSPTPSRVSPTTLARPVGWPAAPSPSPRDRPPPQVPGPARLLLSCAAAAHGADSPRVCRECRPLPPGPGVRMRGVPGAE